MRVEALSKSFGRVAALTNLTFSIGEREIVGLIGPVRSAVVDLLAGKISPTFGRIRIGGEDVTQLGPDARTRCGVVRGLQPADLFLDLTVLENVVLGAAGRPAPLFSRRGGKTYQDEAASVLEFTGLARLSNSRAGELSQGEQRLLTIAVALAAKPSLLLLDGLAAGLTRTERLALESLLSEVRDNGTSILISDSAIWPLMDVCDRVLVLISGRLIADDVPSRIAPYLDAGLSHVIAAPSPVPIAI